MHHQTDRKQPFWRSKSFHHIALLLTLIGFAFMFLSENGLAVLIIGGTALFLAHIAAFTGLLMLVGSWLAKRFSIGKSPKQEV